MRVVELLSSPGVGCGHLQEVTDDSAAGTAHSAQNMVRKWGYCASVSLTAGIAAGRDADSGLCAAQEIQVKALSAALKSHSCL